MHQIFKQTFDKITNDLFHSGIDITFSGSTNVSVLVIENMVWCANIGDSRAIIAQQGGKCLELSKDHKPDLPKEFRRILQHGGRVQPYSDEDGQPVGPARVWLRDENIPGLAMSRSFGDYVASSVGVTSEPEILKHVMTPNDKFMVVASDGIWE